MEGKHYYEPLEERTYSTYGGITRGGIAGPSHLAGCVITSIKPPDEGWPIVVYCEVCEKIEIVLSPFALKPEKGDYWFIRGMCIDPDDETATRHNIFANLNADSRNRYRSSSPVIIPAESPSAGAPQSSPPAPAGEPPATTDADRY